MELLPPVHGSPLETLTRVLGRAVADELDAGGDDLELHWLLIVWPAVDEPATGFVVGPAVEPADEPDGDGLLVTRVNPREPGDGLTLAARAGNGPLGAPLPDQPVAVDAITGAVVGAIDRVLIKLRDELNTAEDLRQRGNGNPFPAAQALALRSRLGGAELLASELLELLGVA